MAIDAPIPAMQPTPPPSSAVLAPPPVDKWQALRQIGWWKPIDSIIVFLTLALWAGCANWSVFGHPALLQLAVILLVSVLLIQCWLILLVYRSMTFVLELRASMEMLPFNSARIAVGFMQGGQGPQ